MRLTASHRISSSQLHLTCPQRACAAIQSLGRGNHILVRTSSCSRHDRHDEARQVKLCRLGQLSAYRSDLYNLIQGICTAGVHTRWVQALPFKVVGCPCTPIQRSRLMHWSMTPSTGTPLCNKAMRVPNVGLPTGGAPSAGQRPCSHPGQSCGYSPCGQSDNVRNPSREQLLLKRHCHLHARRSKQAL